MISLTALRSTSNSVSLFLWILDSRSGETLLFGPVCGCGCCGIGFAATGGVAPQGTMQRVPPWFSHTRGVGSLAFGYQPMFTTSASPILSPKRRSVDLPSLLSDAKD